MLGGFGGLLKSVGCSLLSLKAQIDGMSCKSSRH